MRATLAQAWAMVSIARRGPICTAIISSGRMVVAPLRAERDDISTAIGHQPRATRDRAESGPSPRSAPCTRASGRDHLIQAGL